MNLKRECSDNADLFHPRKRFRLRLRTKIKVKEEEPFVTHDSLYTEEDEDWTSDDDWDVFVDNFHAKKKTRFRNIFWGKRQSAWMGSVRVKGTTVRSCSRQSDVLAAKILNTRCKNQGITPPNPDAGFLASTELAKYTASDLSSKKTKSTAAVQKAFGKQNLNIPVAKNKNRKKGKTRSSSSSRSSPFKNIFWGTQQKAWMGNIRVKGIIVRSCSRKSDVQAAKILNSRCREAGITPPNPEVGFISAREEKKYLSKAKKKKCKTERGTKTEVPHSGRLYIDTATNTAEPTISVKIEQPNETLQVTVKPETTCSYNNVLWSPHDQGPFTDACISNLNNSALPIGPDLTLVEFESTETLFPDFLLDSSKLLPFDNIFETDFKDPFNPLEDTLSPRTQISLETVDLQPPILNDEDFQSMNKIMFKYISDSLPERTRKYHEARTSKLIPLNSLLM